MLNTNPETGVPYGTIYMNSLDSDTANELWYTYGKDLSYAKALEELKSDLEREAENIEDESRIAVMERYEKLSDREYEAILENEVECAYLRLGYGDREAFVEGEMDCRGQNIYIDEPTIEGECEGVKYHISWLGGAPLLWVFESPYTGLYRRCSPCVPGAGDLNSPDEDGSLCYDVPPDWRAAA